jgi:hypothetical protein
MEPDRFPQDDSEPWHDLLEFCAACKLMAGLLQPRPYRKEQAGNVEITVGTGCFYIHGQRFLLTPRKLQLFQVLNEATEPITFEAAHDRVFGEDVSDSPDRNKLIRELKRLLQNELRDLFKLPPSAQPIKVINRHPGHHGIGQSYAD